MKIKVNRMLSSLVVAIGILLLCLTVGCLIAIIIYGIVALLIYSTWIGVGVILSIAIALFTYIIYEVA